jgi:hypothetical protein
VTMSKVTGESRRIDSCIRRGTPMTAVVIDSTQCGSAQ